MTTEAADKQSSLEADLKDEIIRMYQEVADHPDGEFHFFTAARPQNCLAMRPSGSTARPRARSRRLRGSETRTSAAT
jgi:hypothetical protein